MNQAQKEHKLPIVVLVSGSGSNLQAIIDAIQSGDLPAEIKAVISNRPDAFALERARKAGIPARVIDHTSYTTRESFDHALQQQIDDLNPGLLVLAGFMRILTPDFVEHYCGRMINIHPSLLPEFRGLNTHERVMESGVKQHGATVHFVTTELDGGPIIIQSRVNVLDTDTKDTLAARVLAMEHKIYPLVIRWYAEGRLKLVNNHASLDDKVLEQPLMYESDFVQQA
jgi:phosphoribosylglycinamide formyltransferase-1